MAIRIECVANTSEVFVLVAVVTGLDPLGVSAVKLLAKLLTKPVTLNTLLVKQNIVVDDDDLFNNPVSVNACKMRH